MEKTKQQLRKEYEDASEKAWEAWEARVACAWGAREKAWKKAREARKAWEKAK